MRNIKYLLLCLYFFSCGAKAQGFLCPTTYKYIDLGNTLAEVTAACGKPLSTSTSQQPKTINEPVDQWVYYGYNDEDTPGNWRSNMVSVPSDFDIYMYRTPKIIITFKHDKVISVTMDSQEVGKTSRCDEYNTIKKGDSKDTVAYYCGAPVVRNAGSQTTYQGLVQVTTWKYQFNQYQSPLILQFENGKLTQINAPQ